MGRRSGGEEGMSSRNGNGHGPDPVAARGGAGGRNNSKHKGSLAEMRFMLDAAERGFGVAKPYVDNERYDLIVDAPRRLWRVQVKVSEARHHKGFSVRACWRSGKGYMPYTAEQIDFLAVVVQGPGFLQRAREAGSWRRRRIWYVIPVEALGGRLTIHVYPFGCRRGSEERFEEYREGWGLLERE